MTRSAFVIIATQAQPWSAVHTTGQVPTWIAGLGATETYFCAYSSGSAGESWISKKIIAGLNMPVTQIRVYSSGSQLFTALITGFSKR